MNAIELMVKEHENISRMLEVVRKYCYKIIKNEEVDYDDFYKIIEFIRIYADKIHHGKEEDFLFNRMAEEIGGAAEKLVKHGMLVEHDLGRLYVSDLEAAIESFKDGNDKARVDIIGSAMSYVNLLTRHIEKENTVAYKFAERSLKEESIQAINEECRKFEEEDIFNKKKYIKILEELEEKITEA